MASSLHPIKVEAAMLETQEKPLTLESPEDLGYDMLLLQQESLMARLVEVNQEILKRNGDLIKPAKEWPLSGLAGHKDKLESSSIEAKGINLILNIILNNRLKKQIQ
jgi:hypothetical protein